LKLTADSISATIPTGKPIVLLGRDTWPLLPLLRSRGLSVQYFMWGRKNGAGDSTFGQWFKEVPPGAAVIDSGYSGSIIDIIREKDHSVSGYLMSRGTSIEYPQLLQIPDHHQRTSQLESLVKFTPRSTSYTKNGGVITAGETDADSDTPVIKKSAREGPNNRWFAELDMRRMLREAGMAEWDAWRYSSYVGLTPAERLGLDGQAEIAAHYQAVEAQRSAAGATFGK
jgi:hypothetical protein